VNDKHLPSDHKTLVTRATIWYEIYLMMMMMMMININFPSSIYFTFTTFILLLSYSFLLSFIPFFAFFLFHYASSHLCPLFCLSSFLAPFVLFFLSISYSLFFLSSSSPFFPCSVCLPLFYLCSFHLLQSSFHAVKCCYPLHRWLQSWNFVSRTRNVTEIGRDSEHGAMGPNICLRHTNGLFALTHAISLLLPQRRKIYIRP
jgi:hypothetical protein